MSALMFSNGRVHKSTCKKIPAAAVDLTVTDAEALRSATPASCCKPKAALAALQSEIEAAPPIAEVLAEAIATPTHAGDCERTDAHRVPDECPIGGPSAARVSSPTAQPLAPVEAWDHEVRVLLESVDKAPRYLWRSFAAGADAVADAFVGVLAEADAKSFTVVLRGNDRDTLLLAAETTRSIWTQAVADYKVWRKTDATYAALPPRGSAWSTSERFAAEQAHLTAFCRSLAEVL